MISMRQYSASPRIKQLISYHSEYFEATWVDDFYDVVWNVDTAQGFGLDIWGRIVGVENGRNVTVAEVNYLGFKTESVSQGWKPFGSAVFFSGIVGGQSYVLSDSAYRTLIMTKAFTNISDMTTFNLNKMLQTLFKGRGRCFVRDFGNMEIQYVFDFALTPWERGLFQSNAVPGPAGVLVSTLILPGDLLGFSEAGDGYFPFGEGTLLSSGDL